MIKYSLIRETETHRNIDEKSGVWRENNNWKIEPLKFRSNRPKARRSRRQPKKEKHHQIEKKANLIKTNFTKIFIKITTPVLLNVYKVFVWPHLTFCNQAWYLQFEKRIKC